MFPQKLSDAQNLHWSLNEGWGAVSVNVSLHFSTSSLKSLSVGSSDAMMSTSTCFQDPNSQIELCSGFAILQPWIGSFTSVMDLHICDCAELTSRSEEMHSLKSLPTLKNFHCWNLLEDAKRKHFKFKNRESHAWCRFHQYRETFRVWNPPL